MYISLTIISPTKVYLWLLTVIHLHLTHLMSLYTRFGSCIDTLSAAYIIDLLSSIFKFIHMYAEDKTLLSTFQFTKTPKNIRLYDNHCIWKYLQYFLVTQNSMLKVSIMLAERREEYSTTHNILVQLKKKQFDWSMISFSFTDISKAYAQIKSFLLFTIWQTLKQQQNKYHICIHLLCSYRT